MKSRRLIAPRSSRVISFSRAVSERRSSSPCFAAIPNSTVAAIWYADSCADLVRVRTAIRRLLDELGVDRVRFGGRLGVDRLFAVGEELDRAGRVGELLLARLDPEHARAARDEVEAAVGHPLEHLGDLARAADRAQPVVGDPDDPELALLLEHPRHHRLVALLEDVQRDQLAGQRDEAEREQREIAHQRHGESVPPQAGRSARGRVTRGAGRAPYSTWMRTAIVWFRRDLRVHDHPALTAAHREADRVVPVFVLDPRLLHGGRFPSANRAWFLLAALRELRASLRERGGELFVRAGKPEEVLPALALETGAEAVYFASDVSPFAIARDRRVSRPSSRPHGSRATSSPTSARRARRTAARSASSARSGAAGRSFRAGPFTVRRAR